MGPKADLYQTRIQSDSTKHARRYAPDVVIRAEHAWQEAQQAHKAKHFTDASEYLNKALLLLESAFVEAQRIELEQQTAVMLKRASEAAAQAKRDDQSRQAIEDETARVLAAAIARAEASRALAFAEAEESKTLASSSEAMRILQSKAELVFASALALGASEDAIRSAETALQQAQSQPSVQNAELALRTSQLALANARKNHATPTLEEVNSLITEAHMAGFEAQTSDNGVTLLLQGLFDGNSAELPQRSKRLLKRIASLCMHFPRGSLLLFVTNENALTRIRNTRIRAYLIAEGVDDQRIQIHSTKSNSDMLIRVVFSDYVAH